MAQMSDPPRIHFVTAIDGKTVGDTAIFTVDSFAEIIHTILIVTRNVTGLTTPPTFSLGNNSTPFDNVLGATVGPTGNAVYTTYLAKTEAKLLAVTSDVKCRVSVAAVATTYLFDIYIIEFPFVTAI